MPIHVEEIQFSEILPIWRDHLWVGRQSPIEPTSAIDINGEIDGRLIQSPVKFWAILHHQNLLAVSSAFPTSKTLFRLRGTWVHPEHRRKKLGAELLKHIFLYAQSQGAELVWTMPRASSWGFYAQLGFTITKEITKYEFGPHYIATRNL